MLLKILSWNINHIYDNWFERIDNINMELEKEVNTTDIIAIQEATIPFKNTISDIYKFLEKNSINTNYFPSAELFMERNYLYKKIFDFFPKYKYQIIRIFEYIMNKILYGCCLFCSKYGEQLKEIYFRHPYFVGFLFILCPILVFPCFFSGVLTILNRKIKGVVKTKWVGRTVQYTEFKYNNREVIFMNVHLSPQPSQKRKTLNEIKKIYNFIKKKEIQILAGDFNCEPTDEVYKYLEKKGFRSVIKETFGKEIKTWPSKNPSKCIDYIWIKGDNIDIKDAKIISNIKATDHYGIKVTLDIKLK